jgi:hypothetical protein
VPPVVQIHREFDSIALPGCYNTVEEFAEWKKGLFAQDFHGMPPDKIHLVSGLRSLAGTPHAQKPAVGIELK